MFTEYVCQTGWDNRPHRAWTTLLSFAMQAIAVSVLLLTPFIYTSVLPQLQFMRPLIAPTAAPAPAPVQSEPTVSQSTRSELNVAGQPIAPRSIPRFTPIINDAIAPPQIPGAVLGSTGDRVGYNLIGNIITRSTVGLAPPLPPTKPTVRTVRTSRLMEAYLIHRVQPAYPPLARQAHIQGPVLLHAVIAKDGTIENLTVLSGHPMLVKAALDAVRQWRYRPLYLNGEPVEVDTQVTVNFVLAGG
jgi:protein TonB